MAKTILTKNSKQKDQQKNWWTSEDIEWIKWNRLFSNWRC